MHSVIVAATDGGNPFSIATNGSRVVVSRLSKANRQNHISFSAADVYRVLNEVADAAEQLEQDKP